MVTGNLSWTARSNARDAPSIIETFCSTRLWNDPSVFWWLRQNVLVYASHKRLESNRELDALYRRVKGRTPLDLAHPEAYIARVNLGGDK